MSVSPQKQSGFDVLLSNEDYLQINKKMSETVRQNESIKAMYEQIIQEKNNLLKRNEQLVKFQQEIKSEVNGLIHQIIQMSKKLIQLQQQKAQFQLQNEEHTQISRKCQFLQKENQNLKLQLEKQINSRQIIMRENQCLLQSLKTQLKDSTQKNQTLLCQNKRLNEIIAVASSKVIQMNGIVQNIQSSKIRLSERFSKQDHKESLQKKDERARSQQKFQSIIMSQESQQQIIVDSLTSIGNYLNQSKKIIQQLQKRSQSAQSQLQNYAQQHQVMSKRLQVLSYRCSTLENFKDQELNISEVIQRKCKTIRQEVNKDDAVKLMEELISKYHSVLDHQFSKQLQIFLNEDE